MPFHAVYLSYFISPCQGTSRLRSNNYNLIGIYLFKVNSRNTRTICEICSKLTIKTPERRQWQCAKVSKY